MILQTLKTKVIVLAKEQQVQIKGGTNSIDAVFILIEDVDSV